MMVLASGVQICGREQAGGLYTGAAQAAKTEILANGGNGWK
jgi:hypothetical protein